ncbi:wall-associated receptor kinase-like 8 [Chenopodium quinoa]|uniref:wall-associated receptor kinase-like 8 n=1 Tax=Chenopodium quinoa TaxID=63459 RepID=UPI000B76E05B|nr:wall-associated receptor kinase-like 8 [Chenopodium quinoa]
MLMSLFLFLLLACLVLQLTASYSPPSYAKPGCQEHCGDVLIPYPFGISSNCYHNKFYEIICNTSFRTPKPFLHKFNLEVMNIQWEDSDPSDQYRYLLVRTAVHNTCRTNASIDFSGSPFAFSSSSNVLVMEGCSGSIVLRNRRGNILSGCATVCGKHTAVKKDLYGVGGCQALLTNNESSFEFYELDLDVEAGSSTCGNMRIGIMDVDSLSRLSVNELSKTTVPTMLRWAAPASYIQANSVVYHHNFYCESNSFDKGCSCHDYYEGNPYLPYGCQLVKECRKCRHGCDTTGLHYYCRKNPLLEWGSVLGFSLGMGLMVLLFGSYGLYRVLKKRREIRNKSDYFKRNGGLLLQQQLCSSEGAHQSTKVFSVTELEKATDNFNKNRILGQGGQGTVYKGMLKDGRIVAIKKSKKVDENQLEQFINEVVILSEINHRNVVRLLGCCLETEVPLLVYEFIQNGTLYQHIHDASGDFHVTWKMRLQMAAESADAIAYLHSSSSAPIYHRDIKSANILLDAKFRAKVSDFGASRAIDIDQTHVTTCVIGTYGYLDPEYFQSNVFTEKSDVYSFGVVLVELITGKKPICPTNDGGWISLAVEFLFHMENSRLFDILDPRILDEGKKEEFVAVANLARQCLNMNGKERPTMKEIAIVLDEIRSSHVSYSTEPNSMVGKEVMMEMSDNKHGGSSSTSSFFPGVGTGASSTVVQRTMAHTL